MAIANQTHYNDSADFWRSLRNCMVPCAATVAHDERGETIIRMRQDGNRVLLVDVYVNHIPFRSHTWHPINNRIIHYLRPGVQLTFDARIRIYRSYKRGEQVGLFGTRNIEVVS